MPLATDCNPEVAAESGRDAGIKKEILPGVTLLRLGGHFPGSAVLHWTGGDGLSHHGLLFSGDTVQVVLDQGWVTFMDSFPNFIPLPAAEVRTMIIPCPMQRCPAVMQDISALPCQSCW